MDSAQLDSLSGPRRQCKTQKHTAGATAVSPTVELDGRKQRTAPFQTHECYAWPNAVRKDFLHGTAMLRTMIDPHCTLSTYKLAHTGQTTL